MSVAASGGCNRVINDALLARVSESRLAALDGANDRRFLRGGLRLSDLASCVSRVGLCNLRAQGEREIARGRADRRA